MGAKCSAASAPLLDGLFLPCGKGWRGPTTASESHAVPPQGTRAGPAVAITLKQHARDGSTPLIDWADVVVATCDDSCPNVPRQALRQLPAAGSENQPVEHVRAIRDDIAGRVTTLLRDLDA